MVMENDYNYQPNTSERVPYQTFQNWTHSKTLKYYCIENPFHLSKQHSNILKEYLFY